MMGGERKGRKRMGGQIRRWGQQELQMTTTSMRLTLPALKGGDAVAGDSRVFFHSAASRRCRLM